MAKSSGIGNLIKWIVIIGVLIIGYREGWPWLQAKIDAFSAGSPSNSERAGLSCAIQADRANLAWGGGIGRFVNPPVDTTAWDSFRTQVEADISQARSSCGCAEPSCTKAREALADLDNLIRSFDSAVRSGSPPRGDVVSRQEAIDSKIEQAVSLAKSGD